MKEKFYSIKLISLHGRGYIMPAKKGYVLSENHCDECMKFPSPKEAFEFIKKNRVEKNGFKAFVRNSDEIESELAKSKASHGLMRGEYKIVNEKGENAHYSKKHERYFFHEKEEGCAAWYDKPSVKEFVQKIQGYFPNMKIKARKLKS